MGGIIGTVVGVAVAIFGFLAMRNPIRLSIFAPGEEGYYQRMVLSASSRNSLRAFGMLICLFGSGIAASALAARFKTRALKDVSTALWSLMTLAFLALWCFGVGFAIWQALRGKSVGWSEWFQTRKKGIELGPIDVFPPITPRMRREALVFTVGFLVLVLVAAGAALIR